MDFGNLKSQEGVESLNNHLSTRSYIEGYLPTKLDNDVFEALSSAPSSNLPHALRWYNHIASYGNERKSFQNSVSTLSQPNGDDEDVDLFGSDDDEDAEKLREERLQAYHDKKAKKPALIAKSSVVLEVKPWDDETDMKLMEEKVRSVSCDGLLWGAAKLVPVGYGINKLQIICTVEDDKVSVDWLQETIQEFEDVVQSVDIAAFNKI